MTRRHLFLTVAGLTVAAATVAAAAPVRPSLPPAAVRQAPARTASANEPAVRVDWVARYGRFDARSGKWNLIPEPNPRGC